MRSHLSRPVLAAVAAGTLAAGLVAAVPAEAGTPGHGGGKGHRSGPVYLDAHQPVRKRVADLLSRMSLADEIGQMTQTERADVTDDPTRITSWRVGSVLSGGGSVPTPNTAQAFADMVDTFQKAALATPLHIPLLYGIDSVHGDGNLYGATVFPHNIGLGATRDPKLVEKVEHITAIETRASGPNWVFAPCICVARDDRWGRTYESFGEDPKLVESMETAIDGFQGRSTKDLARPDRVLATAKHFAGDGLTSYDASKAGTGAYPIDQGVDEVTHQEFARLALAPYVDAIRHHGVESVMPSYSSVDYTDDSAGPVKMSADKDLITGWLKHTTGFDGLVISDWQAIRQLPGSYSDQVAAGVNAGIDMFMEPYSGSATGAPEFESTLTDLVDAGTVPRSRIDDAVARILRVKFELGLFEHPYTPRGLQDTIGDDAHHAVARQAAAESQVLLKNDGATLPLRSGAQPVYVAGSNADSMGNQAGGWTLQWQGSSANDIPGTTILDGIEQEAGGDVTYSADASDPVPSDAAGIVVVGETPYAEGVGDVGGPGGQTMTLSAADTQAIETVCSQAASCTVLVVSGRPLIIPPELLDQIDALVASWLPGSEGIGVADDLFGRHAFTGKLPVTWPRSLDQEPINVGDADYDPLYAYGYGLTTKVVGRHRH